MFKPCASSSPTPSGEPSQSTSGFSLASHVLPRLCPGGPVLMAEKKQQAGCSFGAILAVTGIWALLTGRGETASESRAYFPLPERLYVTDTTLPYRVEPAPDGGAKGDKCGRARKYIEPEKLDLSGSFYLETDRYTLIKGDDWLPSRAVGHLLSLPTKLFFWDGQIGWGIDGDGTKNALSMLERDKEVSGLVVRINHNEVFYDTGRALFGERPSERNNVVARLVLGTVGTFVSEAFSELRRGDYYNPMTGTVVLYSNVPAIMAHEIGHHKDYARFSSDWIYTLVTKFPGAILYPEWQASARARDELLPPESRWQFYRYLIPAFGTYVLYSLVGLGLLRRKGRSEQE